MAAGRPALLRRLLILFFACLLWSGPAAADIVGESAPDFSATDVTGAVVSLSQFSYKTVMLFHFNVYCHS